MRKFEKFLFFYSIIAVTVLLISSGVFNPKPLNFISILVLAPIVFYFWIRLTSPQAVGPDKWTLRFLISLVLLGALGIYGMFLSKQFTDNQPVIDKQLVDVQKQNEDLKTKIESLTTELSDMKNQSITEPGDESITDLIYGTPLPDSTASGQIQRIKAKSGVTKIDVYQNPVASSQKLGSADVDVIYPYIEKQGTWYKIVYTASSTGWVSATQVQETQ